MTGLLERGHGWLLRRLLLPLGDRAFGQRMTERLALLERAQWWDEARLADARDAAVARLAEVAYREVPFWRAQMDAAGVAPAEVRSAGALGRLPVVTKAMLRAHYPEGTTRPTGQRTYAAATSGSTGTNFQVLEDAYTAGWYRASLLLALSWAGWRPGMPHLQTGMTLARSPDRRLKDALMRCHYVSAYDLRPEALDRALDLLERHRVRFLFGYPGSLYVLARHARERGWNRPLEAAATWGDMLYPHYRREIAEAFGARVFDVYGIGEGVHISAECEHGRHHVHMLDVVLDLVDDEGRPVPDGTPGSVVVTRLHPGPMPLIRYRVGDVATRSAGGPCPCGRRWDVLEGVQGRDTDIVVTPSGNRLIVHFFTGILEHFFPQVDSFQAVQEEAGALLLRVVPGPGYTAEVGRAAVAALHERGADLRIDLETVDEIPLPPTGKRRFVVSPYARALREAETAPAAAGGAP